MKKYSVDYFLRKFARIPEDKWTSGMMVDSVGRRCALGHCGCRRYSYTLESQALTKLLASAGFPTPVKINDSLEEAGSTPKERIMNTLILLKAVQEAEAENV